MAKRAVIFCLFLFFGNSMLFAAQMINLYTARVDVPAKTDDYKEQAVTDGLLQVLTKLSGNSLIKDSPDIQDNLKKADYFVQDMNYSDSTPDSSQYSLSIRYNPIDVQRILKNADIPIWGEVRPLILAWVAIDNGQGEFEIVNQDSKNELWQALELISQKYGLPLMMPLMDVTDLHQVEVNDVLNASVKTLKKAGERYAPEALLIGKIFKTDNGVQTKWLLVLDKKQWQWETQTEKLEQSIAITMATVNQSLAKHFLEVEAKSHVQ